MTQPSEPVDHGRDARGRFATGNKLSKGNPYAAHVGRLRSELMAAATPERMRRILDRLFEMAEHGDLHAIKEVLLRVLGRPVESDLIERLEALEERAGGEATRRSG